MRAPSPSSLALAGARARGVLRRRRSPRRPAARLDARRHARRHRRRRLPRGRPRRAADRPRRAGPARPHAGDVRPAHRHPRARRGVARAGAVPGSHRRPVHVDLPPAGGVLDADARRRRPRAQPRAPAGRVRHRRHHRQRAAQRARRMALATLDGGTVDPDSGARGYDGVQDADSADPFYYRPDHDAPRHPGALARAQRPFKAQGLRGALVPAGRQPRRARPGRGPADAGDRRLRHRRPARPERWTPTSSRRATRSTRSRPSSRLLADQVPLDTIRTPADPDAPAERARRGRAPPRPPATWTTRSTSARVRAILVDTVNRDGTSQARINPAQIERLRAQLDATDRWVLVLSHNPLTDEALAILDAAPAGRRRDRRQLAPNRITAARPLLADQHLLARRLPAASAHVPPARDDRRGVALETWMVDHDGRGLAGISRELAYLDAQGGRPQHFAGTRGPQRTSVLRQRRNRNTCRSLPFFKQAPNREEKYVNTRAFLGACRCPEPRRRMPEPDGARCRSASPDGSGATRRRRATPSARWISSPGRGYAIGDDGTALRTDDGGATWTGLATGTSQDLTRLQAVTPDVVIVLGGDGCVVRRSDDGGKTFRKIFVLAETNCPDRVAAALLRHAAGRLPAAARRQRAAHDRRRPDVRPRDRDPRHAGERRRRPGRARRRDLHHARRGHRLPRRRPTPRSARPTRAPRWTPEPDVGPGSVTRMKASPDHVLRLRPGHAAAFRRRRPDLAGARRQRRQHDHRHQLRDATTSACSPPTAATAAAHRERRRDRTSRSRPAPRRSSPPGFANADPRRRRRLRRRDRRLRRRRPQLHAGRRRHRGLLPVRPAARPGAQDRARARRPRPARAHDRQRRHLEGDQRRHLAPTCATRRSPTRRQRLRARRARRPVPHRQRRRELAADRPRHDLRAAGRDHERRHRPARRPARHPARHRRRRVHRRRQPARAWVDQFDRAGIGDLRLRRDDDRAHHQRRPRVDGDQGPVAQARPEAGRSLRDLEMTSANARLRARHQRPRVAHEQRRPALDRAAGRRHRQRPRARVRLRHPAATSRSAATRPTTASPTSSAPPTAASTGARSGSPAAASRAPRA